MELSILVVFDANNKSVGIKNTKLPILLLNELKKLTAENQEQQAQIEQLKQKVKELENK